VNFLALVIPCYNEAERFRKEDFSDFLKGRANVFLYFVNDGSTDQTGVVLQDFRQLHPGQVKVLNLSVNVGKAEAVRQGILEALRSRQIAVVGYFDADLSTPLQEGLRLMVHMDQSSAVMAFGSRIKRLGIRLDRHPFRHYLGRIFATEASLLLDLPVYDTQCGAKVFRAEAAREIFDRPFLSRWFFDVEIFFRLKQRFGRARTEQLVIEVPLNEWVEQGGSRVKPLDFLRAPFELLRIWLAYRAAKPAAEGR
jgi:glycosyltransferase involved in cell wall biosynthesis